MLKFIIIAIIVLLVLSAMGIIPKESANKGIKVLGKIALVLITIVVVIWIILAIFGISLFSLM